MLNVNVEYIKEKIVLANNTIETSFLHDYLCKLRDCGLLLPQEYKPLFERVCGKQYYLLMEEYE